MLGDVLISESSHWKLIQVPNGFDVVDVVLVDASSPPVIFSIQITRSVKPFAKHHTFDTCPPRSTARLNKLWSVISNRFGLDDRFKLFYVMLAPNCEKDEFKPPPSHQNDFYFAPATIITEYALTTTRKRSDPL